MFKKLFVKKEFWSWKIWVQQILAAKKFGSEVFGGQKEFQIKQAEAEVVPSSSLVKF